jgi:hypothetical protein
MSSQVLEKIISSGISGVKKADLKKSFGKECDEIIEELSKEDKIIVDHKGVAHFVWTKENYVTHLAQNDPKYKLILNHFRQLETSIAEVKEKTRHFAKIEAKPHEVNDSNFEIHFNESLKQFATSLGWIPLADIRAKLCPSLNLTQDKFYSLAANLVESNRNKYEISTGGQEGIVSRGLVHGYVRLL